MDARHQGRIRAGCAEDSPLSFVLRCFLYVFFFFLFLALVFVIICRKLSPIISNLQLEVTSKSGIPPNLIPMGGICVRQDIKDGGVSNLFTKHPLGPPAIGPEGTSIREPHRPRPGTTAWGSPRLWSGLGVVGRGYGARSNRIGYRTSWRSH